MKYLRGYLSENYGSVLRDCAKAISLNSECAKAYYRSAQALLALGRVDEALDGCERCLSFDPNNAGVKALQSRVVPAIGPPVAASAHPATAAVDGPVPQHTLLADGPAHSARIHSWARVPMLVPAAAASPS